MTRRDLGTEGEGLLAEAWRNYTMRKNDLQLARADTPFPEAVDEELNYIDQRLAEIERILGYMPAP